MLLERLPSHLLYLSGIVRDASDSVSFHNEEWTVKGACKPAIFDAVDVFGGSIEGFVYVYGSADLRHFCWSFED